MKQWHLLRSLSESLTRTLAAHSPDTVRFLSSATASPTFALKNVTKSNFESSLADLRRHVRDADFVAIDLEMTGVTSAPWRESFEFDRFDVQYLKVKDSAEKFAVVQFGVCPFRWDSSRHCFVAHPHNFYVFPRQELPVDGPSYEFLCQTTSIDFLAKYQFDFNACIYEGVSYLSREQENEMLRCLNSECDDEMSLLWRNMKEVRDTPLVSVADVLFSERMKNRFNEWRKELLQDRKGGSQFLETSNDMKQQFQTIFFKMRPALILNGFTAHQLRLIQLVIKKHFKDLVYIRSSGDGSYSELIVYIDSDKDKNLLMKEVKDGLRREAEMKIKTAVGFRHVIDLLSYEQKLIVGHNCLLDIAHIYNKFFGPLPLTAEDFVSSIHKYFPYMIDTKILLNTNNVLKHLMKNGSTSLSKAFASLCPQIASSSKNSGLAFQPWVEVEVQVDDMRSSNWNSGAKHEAGYDAFMTGCVFAQACSNLGIDFKKHSSSANLAHNKNLQKYVNHLYFSWVNGDIIDLSTGNRIAATTVCYNLKRRYPKILFSNIVIVWGFPSQLSSKKMRECISKVFGPISVTTIYHLDETAVFVQFSKPELVADFLVLKETLETIQDPISVLHPLSVLLEGGNTCAASYETYKEICSSPISKVMFADQAKAVGIKWKTKLIESKEKVKTQEDESFSKENGATDAASDSAAKSKTRKIEDVIDNLSDDRNSGSEIIDSLYAAQTKLSKHMRTTNL
ncbi:poly(A)-specific ribonuclease PARN [Vitis riparia]|uniref:poly(A)-specific ribonuclease PARN n=1 Tax=Vitis riparia TaxID=96939 RepID=UPI00155B3E6A|nr:poly(A)-specific ribonuclease PARN [Vitis riparia]XP_034679290.1 poly(A)-specific ribonuclease PARN [Vitis riparia]XP_034679291.1 poly(A)-specific ribonuclease PARN [Vitis riparia]